MKKTALASIVLFALPFTAFAQVGTLAPIQQLIVSIGNLMALIIPLLIGAAVVMFFWGLVQYIRNPAATTGGEHGKNKGATMMQAGIVSLFVMVSIWGIIRFAQVALLGGTPNQTIQAPHIPTN